MYTHQLLLNRLSESSYNGTRIQELYNKFRQEDLENLFFSKEKGREGIWVQIKTQLKEVNILEVDIPGVGRLTAIPKMMRKELFKFNRMKSDALRNDPVDLDYLNYVNCQITKYTGLMLKYYCNCEINDYVRKLKTTKAMIKDKVYVDPILQEQVQSILQEPNLTADGFIYKLKQVSSYCLKPWFLVAIQVVNEVHAKKGKEKIKKEDFLTMIKESGLDYISAL